MITGNHHAGRRVGHSYQPHHPCYRHGPTCWTPAALCEAMFSAVRLAKVLLYSPAFASGTTLQPPTPSNTPRSFGRTKQASSPPEAQKPDGQVNGGCKQQSPVLLATQKRDYD